jgi:hypothetical protein
MLRGHGRERGYSGLSLGDLFALALLLATGVRAWLLCTVWAREGVLAVARTLAGIGGAG